MHLGTVSAELMLPSSFHSETEEDNSDSFSTTSTHSSLDKNFTIVSTSSTRSS